MRGFIFSFRNLFIIWTVRIPPKVHITKSIRPKAKIKSGFQLRKTCACIVAPTERPSKMVTMFIRECCAVSDSRFTTPHTRIKLPNINIPIRGATAGMRMMIKKVAMRGKKSFSLAETGRSCRILILRCSGVVIRRMIGG